MSVDATAERAAKWWSSRLVRVGADQSAAFEGKLYEVVKAALLKCGRVTLEHDYHARGLLGEVAEETITDRLPKDPSENMFMGHELFPQKHLTRITVGLIKPKEGYGNWTDDIIV